MLLTNRAMEVESRPERGAIAPNSHWVILALLAISFVSGGATCARRDKVLQFNPPHVLPAQPQLQDIMEQVNRSLAITQLESQTLTVSSPDLVPKLRGNLKWERPHNFLLEAYLGSKMLGTALVAGSNTDLFWFQTSQPPPPTLYYARHDQFDIQPGPRRILPVSPLWLREAIGIVEFNPGYLHQPPITRPDGKLEVRSTIPSRRGGYQRHIVLNASTGTIEQTLLYNEVGKLVASAQQMDHQYYSAVDYSLPHKIEVQLYPDDGPVVAFTVEVGFYMINQSSSHATDFTPPEAHGLTTVDLVQANAQPGQPAANPPAYTSARQTSATSNLGNYQGLRR